jgi:hypothetical protein
MLDFIKEFEEMSEEMLLQKMASCERPDDYTLAFQTLERRFLKTIGDKTEKLWKSSRRLERLTTALIWLTVVLVLLTSIAAIPICKNDILPLFKGNKQTARTPMDRSVIQSILF